MSYRTQRYETMTVAVKEGIATVAYNRPQCNNVANFRMRQERIAIFSEIQEDKDIRAVILTGGEKVYCAGGDLKEFSKCETEQATQIGEDGILFQTLLTNLPQPIIAAVSGYAYGGGLESVLLCDLRICSETAVFAMPEINVGIMPGNGGTQRLVQNMSICKAKEMIFLGTPINAQEALRLGLINLVVAQEQLMPLAYQWAEKLCEKPRVALAAAKRMINQAWGQSTCVGMRLEAQEWSSLFATVDQKEGMRAFLEKRRPKFTGY